MKIKKHIHGRRASFRARHNCDNQDQTKHVIGHVERGDSL